MRKFLCGILGGLSMLSAAIGSGFAVFAENNFAENKGSGNAVDASASYGALFESENVSITGGAVSSAYTNISPKQGVLFVAEEEGATVRFRNKLDLSSNKRTDVLAEILIAPTMQDTADFYELILTIEDAYDPGNKLTISYYRGAYDNLIGMIKAKAPGQILAGYNANSKKMYSETERGTPVYSSFNGIGVQGLTGTLTLGLDYESRALYAFPEVYTDLENGNLVNKFSDPKYVSKEWEGFATGEVYISFTFSSIKRGKAQFMLLNLNGQNLGGETINDTKDPVISVYTDGNETVPDGLVDYPYPVFPITVFDEIDGDLDGAQITVYKGEKAAGNVFARGFSAEFKSFTPDEAGIYVFSYETEDRALRKTTVDFCVTVRENLGEFLYIFDEELTENAKVGEKIDIPAGKAVNGSGRVKIKTDIRRIGDENLIDFSENFFVPDKQGVYTVTLTATDYLKRTYTSVNKITVKESEVPLIEKPFVPRYVISGKPVVFDDFEAYDYASTPGYPQKTDRKSIRIYDGNEELLAELDYADRTYVPDISNGNKIIVEYRAACLYDSEKVSVFRKEADVLKIGEVGGYFYDGTGNTSMQAEETSVLYKTTTDGAGREFVNALPSEEFSFTFTVPLSYNHFEKVAVYLEDADDPRQKVKISVVKNADDPESIYSKLYVNDKGEPADILGSFYATTNNFFIIGLDGRSITDASGGSIMSISETMYGERFGGFPSGKIYLSFAMEGVDGEAAVEVSRVLNQMISDIDDDYIRPIILLSGEITRNRHYGEQIKIPAARAVDVLDQKVVLTVSVIDRLGNYLIKDSSIQTDFYFTARSYGTYKIEYKATDSKGNKSTKSYSVEISDEIKPEMTIEGSIPKSIKCGQKLVLPSAVVIDNVSVNLQAYIFVIDESGKMIIAENGEYVFREKGRYTIRYYARDDEYNFVIVDYVIVVK